MSFKKNNTEFSLPVEFDNKVKFGIGLPPKTVLEYNTQYQKVISINKSTDSVTLAGRIVPVPATYHDRSVVVFPEIWENAYGINSSFVVCKLIEPSFANTSKIVKVVENVESLPGIIELLQDKSVLFKGKYFRVLDDICKVISVDGGNKAAITTDITDVILATNSNEEKSGNIGDEFKEAFDVTSHKVKDIKQPSGQLHKIKGIDDKIARIKNEVIYPFRDILDGNTSKPMGGVLLYGPPGCGKTEIATSIAQDLGVHLESVQIGDLSSPYVHQFGKNLKAAFNKAEKAKNGAIIFLDELDAYAGHRSEMNDSHDKENVNVLLQLLDPKNRCPEVLVIGATNYLSSLDTAVTRSGRFDTKIGIGPPDESGRAAILRSKLKEHSVDSNSITEGMILNIAKKTIGYVGSDINTLVDKADSFRKTRARKQGHTNLSLPIIKEDILKATTATTPLCKTSMNIEQPKIQKEDLPGSEKYVEQICREAKLMFKPNSFRSDIEVKPNQAFLLHGPPGTGKTSIANAVANELGILFQVIKAGELKGSLVGETTKNIKKLFQNARLFRPILLFFDEIDSIAQVRGSSKHSGESDSINTLLSQLGDTIDNDKIIFIGATNRFDMIDAALLRPGRFGTHVKVGRPDKPNIKKQLNQQLKVIPHQLTNKELDKIAESIHQQDMTQANIADFLNSVKRYLKFYTEEGEKADYSLLKDILEN